MILRYAQKGVLKMWTNEEINRLKSQHGHGWSVEESADILERSPLDVRNKLIALGLKPIEETTPAPEKAVKKHIRRPRITENAKNSIITMRDSGYALNDIVSNTGISLASVQRILRENGRTNPHKIQSIKPADTKLSEKYAKLEKHVKAVEEIDEKRRIELKRTAEKLANANIEIQMLQNKIKVLESERAEKPKEPADNWSVQELKNVLELLEPLTIDNGADAMTIGEAIGRLKMMISIAYETERRHGF